jgi:hypothetical protein
LASMKWWKIDARCDRGVLPEGGSGGGAGKRMEGSSFIAVHCVGAT